MTTMIHAPVLVLNQNYQPLNICNVRRAMVLVGLGKAELMANGRGDIRTVSASFAVPSVIRLVYMVKQTYHQAQAVPARHLLPGTTSRASTAARGGRP